MIDQQTHSERVDYQTILDVARERTDPSVKPTVTQLDLAGRAVQAGVPKREISDAIDTLVRTGELVRWDPGDGRRELTIADDDHLRRWIQAEADSADPNAELIGALNRKRDGLAGGDE